MKPLGTQLIAEFVYCAKRLLNDRVGLEQMLIDGMKKCGFELISLNGHKFNPVGVTVTAIVGESHIAIHTYPEARHVSLDIFTCSASHKTQKLLKYLKLRLKPKTLRVVELLRGNPIEIIEQDWVTESSLKAFEIRFHAKKKLYSGHSKYQHIEIIENDNFGRMMFLDSDLQIAENDAHLYNKSLVMPLVDRRNKLETVAILGGGDGGVLQETLLHDPKKVVVVDIDEDVINVAKKYLRKICQNAFNDKRAKLVIGDANKFLEKKQKFDAIIYDLTMHPEAFTIKDRALFLDSLFLKVKKSLTKNGMISMQCCSLYDKETRRLIRKSLKKHFNEIEFKETFIPSFCESWLFASACL